MNFWLWILEITRSQYFDDAVYIFPQLFLTAQSKLGSLLFVRFLCYSRPQFVLH